MDVMYVTMLVVCYKLLYVKIYNSRIPKSVFPLINIVDAMVTEMLRIVA